MKAIDDIERDRCEFCRVKASDHKRYYWCNAPIGAPEFLYDEKCSVADAEKCPHLVRSTFTYAVKGE